MNETATKQPAVAGNFLALLQGKTGGVTLLDLDYQLADLVRQVQETGRAGTLTYKVKISPNAKRGVRIDDAVDIKAPKADVGTTFFFVGRDGALLRNDPNQMEMQLKSVPAEDAAQPLKQASNS